MKNLILIGLTLLSLTGMSQDASKVDFNGFEKLTTEVEAYRESRLITVDTFNLYRADPNTIILDTRSKWAYDQIHIQGAIHLNFSDFNVESLERLIPNKNTRILIYCNNNIFSDLPGLRTKSMPLALNIPTFINLYGYGYQNVYELSEYLKDNDPRIPFVTNEVKN